MICPGRRISEADPRSSVFSELVPSGTSTKLMEHSFKILLEKKETFIMNVKILINFDHTKLDAFLNF